MNFFERIRYKRNMRKIKNSILTPKGVCLREYCRKIKENEWTSHDNIEAYEVATYIYEALSIPMEE